MATRNVPGINNPAPFFFDSEGAKVDATLKVQEFMKGFEPALNTGVKMGSTEMITAAMYIAGEAAKLAIIASIPPAAFLINPVIDVSVRAVTTSAPDALAPSFDTSTKKTTEVSGAALISGAHYSIDGVAAIAHILYPISS